MQRPFKFLITPLYMTSHNNFLWLILFFIYFLFTDTQQRITAIYMYHLLIFGCTTFQKLFQMK